MALKLLDAVFGNKDSGERTGKLAVCSCKQTPCGMASASTFRVFQLTGQKHFHLECTVCQTSYCPAGACR